MPERLDRSTLADRVGKSTALLEPLADAIGRHVRAGQAIFADDTPVRMLAPGTGKTATARLWAYGRDERPWGGTAPPASWYRFSPDRKGLRRDNLDESVASIRMRMPVGARRREGAARLKSRANRRRLSFGTF